MELNNYRMELGAKLVNLRKELGLTQEVVAEKLGVTTQAVSKWEKGESSPDIPLLKGIAELYGISLDTLLNVPFYAKIDVIEDRIEEMMNCMPSFNNRSTMMNDIGEEIWRLWKTVFMQEAAVNGQPDKRQKKGRRVLSNFGVRMWDDNGLAAYIRSHMYDKFENLQPEYVEVIKTLLHEEYFKIITLFRPEQKLTRDDVCQSTGYDHEKVTSILFDLVSRELLVTQDNRFYLSAHKGIAISLLLSAVYALQFGPYSTSEYVMDE